ncbi:MAG: hypothetical protein ACI4NR_07860 [Megasphaera sp.]
MEFNKDACTDRLAALCDAVYPEKYAETADAKADYIISEIKDVVEKVNIPTKLDERRTPNEPRKSPSLYATGFFHIILIPSWWFMEKPPFSTSSKSRLGSYSGSFLRRLTRP